MMEDAFTELSRRIRESGQRLLIAVDGRCASGKTTLAASLERETGCNVVHMDDFFLRPEQRFSSIEALRAQIAADCKARAAWRPGQNA